MSVTRLAAAIKRPERFVGMHFFNPVPLMALVELVPGLRTSQATVEAARGFVAAIGKTSIVAKNSPGFAVNRILCPMINEAIFALQEGLASAEEIDAGMKLGCNQPIGPLALADLIGLDTMLSVKAERLSWQAVTVTDLAGRTRITTDAADIQELGFGFESGRGSATGVVPFHADARGRLRAELTNVDIGAATRALAPNATLVPSGRLSAELNAEGPGIDTTRWTFSGSRTAEGLVVPERGRVSRRGTTILDIKLASAAFDDNAKLSDADFEIDAKYALFEAPPLTHFEAAKSLRARGVEREDLYPWLVEHYPEGVPEAALDEIAATLRGEGNPARLQAVG